MDDYPELSGQYKLVDHLDRTSTAYVHHTCGHKINYAAITGEFSDEKPVLIAKQECQHCSNNKKAQTFFR